MDEKKCIKVVFKSIRKKSGKYETLDGDTVLQEYYMRYIKSISELSKKEMEYIVEKYMNFIATLTSIRGIIKREL